MSKAKSNPVSGVPLFKPHARGNGPAHIDRWCEDHGIGLCSPCGASGCVKCVHGCFSIYDPSDPRKEFSYTKCRDLL